MHEIRQSRFDEIRRDTTAAQVDSATVELNRDTRDVVDAERSVDFV